MDPGTSTTNPGSGERENWWQFFFVPLPMVRQRTWPWKRSPASPRPRPCGCVSILGKHMVSPISYPSSLPFHCQQLQSHILSQIHQIHSRGGMGLEVHKLITGTGRSVEPPFLTLLAGGELVGNGERRAEEAQDLHKNFFCNLLQ